MFRLKHLQIDTRPRSSAQPGRASPEGGALDLAPADDILITVERPMELDTEAQMVASILAKKKTVGATHVLIDIPVGATAKVRTLEAAERLSSLFHGVAEDIELRLDVIVTEARGPIDWGIGPRLEALDVLAVLRREDGAPLDLREKSLYLAARLLEMTGAAVPADGYRTAQQALDSGAALHAFERIVAAQGARALPPAAPLRSIVTAETDGRREIDCWQMARVAKCAGAPAHAAAGVRLLPPSATWSRAAPRSSRSTPRARRSSASRAATQRVSRRWCGSASEKQFAATTAPVAG